MQRYLTAPSVDEARASLLMSAYWKIPLQALVLLVGVLMFLFYLFTPPPMLFDPVARARACASGPRAAEYQALEQRFEAATGVARRPRQRVMSERAMPATTRRLARQHGSSRPAKARSRRSATTRSTLVRETTGDRSYNDVNYVFPTFITTHMPVGLVGLLIAAILAAAMSAIAGELSALSTASVIDFYRRFVRPEATDAPLSAACRRVATVFWGLFASVVAVWAAELGSLIEVVNRFGSFFYGSILGVFILAIGFTRATANGAFVGSSPA